MEPDSKPMSTKELTHAVTALLEKEESRDAAQRRRRRHRVRRRRQLLDQRIERLAKSIEVIKWCIISITSVIVISLMIVIMVVMEVEREAERIKGEVQAIQREAEQIRDRIRHPFESLGGRLGRQLEANIGNLLGLEQEEEQP